MYNYYGTETRLTLTLPPPLLPQSKYAFLSLGGIARIHINERVCRVYAGQTNRLRLILSQSHTNQCRKPNANRIQMAPLPSNDTTTTAAANVADVTRYYLQYTCELLLVYRVENNAFETEKLPSRPLCRYCFTIVYHIVRFVNLLSVDYS